MNCPSAVSCKFKSSTVVQLYDWVMKDTQCFFKRLSLAAAILLSSMSRSSRPLDTAVYVMSGFAKRWAVLFCLLM